MFEKFLDISNQARFLQSIQNYACKHFTLKNSIDGRIITWFGYSVQLENIVLQFQAFYVVVHLLHVILHFFYYNGTTVLVFVVQLALCMKRLS